MDSCGNSNGSSGPDAARTGTGYAATGGDGTAGFWYRTDSFPVTGQGSAPYHEPVTGGAYDGYVGMIGDWAKSAGCKDYGLAWSEDALAGIRASFHGPQDARTADDRATVKPQAAAAYISTSQGVNNPVFTGARTRLTPTAARCWASIAAQNRLIRTACADARHGSVHLACAGSSRLGVWVASFRSLAGRRSKISWWWCGLVAEGQLGFAGSLPA
jgi:hypothetical protein